ncbi:MAG: preprotein translocase subunit YajC [Halothiobacillaceae bacterium]|nr:MAG: preprotein translocase subunit YajC [Halothiobacillaceae bacterium]
MDFFISNAWAQAAAPAAGQGADFLSFVPLIIIFLIFYFLLMRPQIKRAKDHRKMIETLSKNDEVSTSGGVMGRIVKMEESYLVLEVAEGVRIKFQKNAVASLLPKGTLKDNATKRDEE